MDWIVPMEPILTSDIPSGGYTHQVKWDGIRGLCYIEDGRARIFTKKGRERTAFYPELSSLPSLVKAHSAVLDGEIIILDEGMKPSFQLSLMRERVTDPSRVNYYAKKYPVQYIVFDLLMLDEKKLTEAPHYKRDSILRETLISRDSVAITDNFSDGLALFEKMKERGWEGIVSKKPDSPYLPGKAHDLWFKTKLSRKLLAVVLGLTLKEGVPNALVLGIWGKEGFVYIGRASIGLTNEHFKLLKEHMDYLKSENPPVSIKSRDLKNVFWLKPTLTVWVGFLEWTNEGGLRHPKILGFSSSEPQEADGKEFVE